MARYLDVHSANPQRRAIGQVVDIVRADGVIAYPTDSCYALGCQLGSKDGITRIRAIRGLDDRHHLTLVCQDFAQLGQFVNIPNPVFRAIKAAQALRAELGEPLVSSTLLLPGQDEPMTEGWQIAAELEHVVDAVIDSGDCGTEPTTVIDFSSPGPEIIRRGAGDTADFE